MIKPLLPRCVLAHWVQGQCLLELEVTVCEGQGRDWDSAQIRLSLQTQILRKEEPMETSTDGSRAGVDGSRQLRLRLQSPCQAQGLRHLPSAWDSSPDPWDCPHSKVKPQHWGPGAGPLLLGRAILRVPRGTEPLTTAVTVTTTLKAAPPCP